ncbi:methyltransferase domain-containing protein [Pseudonocardia sp. TRM90224]|uniref:methyltransferase domain-containing protein n=1 Tax=Pseudonocardia sp. TRM90224 TaxID=2812678 RepID=UPI001E4E3353|nr:methyltransferase domain-containing protein [Pseudonocardia sp. TRM90224]
MVTSTAEFVERLRSLDRDPFFVQLRKRSYHLLAAAPRCRVVDVGCGGGTAVGELTARGVDAVGVDIDPDVVAAARALEPAGTFVEAPAERLPFPDGSVDGYRAEKLLHSLADPADALAEARRVLRPGGRIVLVGQDWDFTAVDADDPALTRRIIAANADTLPNPRAGRAYRNRLLDADFREVTCEIHATVLTTPEHALPALAAVAGSAARAGAVTPQEVERWLADQYDRAGRDRLFVAMPMIVAAGTRARMQR